jgi:threonine 3-dehydrogenase
MANLITGGMGYIGLELAHILVEEGQDVVLFDIAANRERIEDIESRVQVVQGDLGDFSQVLNVVKNNRVTEIYHLGGMLTNMSETNPWASFRTNVIGTYSVLEASRLFGVEKMVFASTIGTFGLQMDEILTDTSVQRPLTMYGCGKLYCENLGRYYRARHGLDFRSFRLAQMIGPGVRTPGHWAPPMIEDAILGKPHECVYASPETVVSMIYVRDAAMAAHRLLEAPKDSIKMVNYNVAVVSAGELERILTKRYPTTRVTYKVDLSVPALRDRSRILKVFDDSYARKEWGWQPRYSTPEEIIDVFERDIRSHPRRYGLE